VLAPEDERRAIEALRFSLASDIVELVVLTADELFLQTLREAVGPTRRLWHVPSSDKVGDLLLAGGVGILVLDLQTLAALGARFVSEIKRQFPDLVVVAAGTREDETALARLISDGTIYRFIHKPMSPARARLFADAAVKKYDEQKRTHGPPGRVAAPRGGRLLPLLVCAGLGATLAAIWLVHRSPSPEPAPRQTAERTGAAAISPAVSLSMRAAQALAANRLAAPAGDNALELFRQALALDPDSAAARAGIAEVHERLLSRAENALLEERLDEAAADLDLARSAGVDAARVAFLAAELAKARSQLKTTATAKRVSSEPAVPAGSRTAPAAPAAQADEFAALAVERIHEQHLLEPERDNARFYVEEALAADPANPAALDAREQLALALLTAARGAIDGRDFARASSSIDAAKDFASPDNLENLRRALQAAQRAADADAARGLLESAEERLRDDRLVEPEGDSARYYLAKLRGIDPANAGLARATQELGARLVGKARSALALGQYDAAGNWLDQAAALGDTSPEAGAVRRDLDAALAKRAFLGNVMNASELELVKSVPPVYPRKAEQAGIEGWVELEFTVAESGNVEDVAVRAANPTGVFDQAAIGALLQWHYKPVIRDARPLAQRARIRIRFALPH